MHASARTALTTWSRAPTGPCLVYGQSGLGKSHLVRSLFPDAVWFTSHSVAMDGTYLYDSMSALVDAIVAVRPHLVVLDDADLIHGTSWDALTCVSTHFIAIAPNKYASPLLRRATGTVVTLYPVWPRFIVPILTQTPHHDSPDKPVNPQHVAEQANGNVGRALTDWSVSGANVGDSVTPYQSLLKALGDRKNPVYWTSIADVERDLAMDHEFVATGFYGHALDYCASFDWAVAQADRLSVVDTLGHTWPELATYLGTYGGVWTLRLDRVWRQVPSPTIVKPLVPLGGRHLTRPSQPPVVKPVAVARKSVKAKSGPPPKRAKRVKPLPKGQTRLFGGAFS